MTIVRSLIILSWLSCAITQAEEKQPGPQRPAPRQLQAELLKNVNVQRDIAYVTAGHERQKLDLYLPQGAGPFPLVIWIHGGAWRAGSKENTPALPLLAQGYAIASINYRLSQHAIFPAQINDCKAAIRWLRENAAKNQLDPDRFAVWGSSAGGHLAALVGTSGDVTEMTGLKEKEPTSSRVQAVIDWFGPTDFTKMGGKHNDAKSPESILVGGAVQEKLDIVKQANPVTYVSKDDPPFLIMHGADDPAVPHSQSELLDQALDRVGVSSELVILPKTGHGGGEFNSPTTRTTISDFLKKSLAKSEKKP